jgi:phage gp36-like protein
VQSDIENAFGIDNVRIWSNLDGSTDVADTNRIAAAIAYAEDYIDSRFRGSRFVVPFSSPTPLIVNWCARLAGMWLYESRPESGDEGKNFSELRNEVELEISQCLAGIIKLNAPWVYTRQGPAVVGRRYLQQYGRMPMQRNKATIADEDY